MFGAVLSLQHPTTNFRSFSNCVGITEIASKAARRSNWIPQLSVAESSRHPGGAWLSWHGTFSISFLCCLVIPSLAQSVHKPNFIDFIVTAV